MLACKKQKIAQKNLCIIDLELLHNRHLKSDERDFCIELSRHSEAFRMSLKKLAEFLGWKYDKAKRVAKKLRLKGMLFVLETNNKGGNLQSHYIYFKEPKSDQFLIEFAQSHDFDMASAVMNGEILKPDIWPPIQICPSKYEYSISDTKVITRTLIEPAKKRYIPNGKPSNRFMKKDQPTGKINRINDFDNIDNITPIEAYQEYEKSHTPVNSTIDTVAGFTVAEKPARNISNLNTNINNNQTITKTKADDDNAAAKIDKKMPVELAVYEKTIQQLAEFDDIPVEFSKRQLPSIIRYNRENPPRKPQDWPKWAENKIVELWDKRQDKAKKQDKRSLDNGEPIKIPEYITLPPENASLASKVYHLDRDLIINLFNKFKAYWIDKGDEYNNWLSRFDEYLAAISESGGQIIPIQWS